MKLLLLKQEKTAKPMISKLFPPHFYRLYLSSISLLEEIFLQGYKGKQGSQGYFGNKGIWLYKDKRMQEDLSFPLIAILP